MIDPDTCRQILADCLPRLTVRTAEPVQDGWCSLVLDVNDEYIFRFARYPDIAAQFEKEIALLPELAESLPVAIPRPEFSWKDCPGCSVPFLGYRKIHGLPLNCTEPSLSLAREIGRALSALHRFPVARAITLGVPDTRPPRWQQEYEELHRWARESALPLLEPSARVASAALWERFLRDEANFAFRPALIHRDLGVEHILCNPSQDRITGIIDWGDACIGDPALDFVGLWAHCGRGFAEAAAAEYDGEIDAAFWDRAAFYTAIIPFYYIQYAQMTSDEALLRDGVERLNRSYS